MMIIGPATDEPRVPRPPRGLGSHGRAEWRRLWERYAFVAGELLLLTEYCHNVDMLARLRTELDAGEMTVHSPQAGPMINRAVAEIRAVQLVQVKLAAELRFRELAAEAEAAQYPALANADLARARPVLGPRDRRSHRRRAV